MPLFTFVRHTLLSLAIGACLHASPTETLYLSGTGSDDTVDWDFKVNGGRNSGAWSSIPVPSNWEMQGFGTYHYYKDWGDSAAPDSLGQYRHRFTVPAEWAGKHVEIVFGASMTDTAVRINGVPAGPVHQGGFYQFSYDITDLLNYGDSNLIEVDVSKFSDDESVNRAERAADYWLFGGIYRPVWLEAKPSNHIERMAVDAKADGSFTVDAYLENDSNAATLQAEVFTLDGTRIAKTQRLPIEPGQPQARLAGLAKNIEPWSAEYPNLYSLRLTLRAKNAVIHQTESTIGFRTIELRPQDGFYLNGEKIILKGSNRHSIWPDTGRATNATLSEKDVLLMKEMNMNAVRMSHYPPDTHFLEACDRLGLYVIDELGGWQKSYDAEVGSKLVRETVIRDVNHPSILLWANGNEGGWNIELDDDFDLYDPQNRPVIHPWANFGGINTSHYESYNSGTDWFFQGDDLFMPTEFLHGLYDGGHGAGLDDWWKAILAHPMGLGGFLWSFADEGIVRDDQGGRIDVAGNAAPDGIVGPYREKEGSFYTIKEIWAPIYLPQSEVDFLPSSFGGSLEIENRYDFTNLDQIVFKWNLQVLEGDSLEKAKLHTIANGQSKGPDVQPNRRGELQLHLPNDWSHADFFALTAIDPHGREIYTWTWSLRHPDTIVSRYISSNATAQASSQSTTDSIVISADDIEVRLDPNTGTLQSLRSGAIVSPMSNGPILLTGNSELKSVETEDGAATFHYEGDLRFVRWELLDSGWLQLDYHYAYEREKPLTYLGVTFDYDESQIEGMRWLGKGPYRVWKNRRKGVEFGLWHKDYNDTVTGMSWTYPEFKGFHEDVYWAQLQNDVAPLDILIASPDLYFRLFTPSEAPDPRSTHVDFPHGDISFLHSIAPIGTKFKTADQHGPAGAPTWVSRGRYHGFSGRVYLRIGDRLEDN
ncbi:glycoside hydrolase family 2 TIM barrel-domain containing protein [Pelagicoccus sp. SDUM812003]|uniref:glycoside hydrolase family 2 TIM barrel-domain containing protein n=1 Tax=Pelagicoccus sp. SDUM812003 TaxID=3041267 RepID=UPI00280CAD57|nr:glycoside hydrolase family 2 TIM barrel-domain containing protein [Pelagicoccus sp. SDUM812003]MDQ8202195.1 glycoside hydrolase family 2 TIM barrel-domain containing protein [Pelagicoccus sp. SDUM812003]